MLRATTVRAKGQWSGPPSDQVRLDFDHRHRRRLAMTTGGGETFLLDLPRATALADGDGLELSDGRIVAVRAAPEPVMDIRCADPADLMRIAWHLGNRHLPTELGERSLRVRDDHVIKAMVEGLGGRVERLVAPFHPEGGAYQGGQGHHHHD